MNTYCGEARSMNVPYSVELSNVRGTYGAKNMYCKWEIFNTDSSQYISVNFTNFVYILVNLVNRC